MKPNKLPCGYTGGGSWTVPEIIVGNIDVLWPGISIAQFKKRAIRRATEREAGAC